MECLYRFIPLLCPSVTDNYSWWCSFHGPPTCHVNEQSTFDGRSMFLNEIKVALVAVRPAYVEMVQAKVRNSGMDKISNMMVGLWLKILSS